MSISPLERHKRHQGDIPKNNNSAPVLEKPAVNNSTPISEETAINNSAPISEEPKVILDKHWIKDNNTGVYLWNLEPSGNENISWSGDFVKDGDYRYAEGFGTVTWYRNGEILQTDEGTFEHGRHNGEFKHIFPSGNVIYSHWNHGEEILNVEPSFIFEARETFINYHNALTNKNYQQAYDILSANQKQRVGKYDSYVAGYSNTISSMVDEIKTIDYDENHCNFEYRLTARDSYQDNGVKVQRFQGKVDLIKVNGSWFIDYAKSQKIDEYVE